jgi:hypothetical protein
MRDTKYINDKSPQELPRPQCLYYLWWNEKYTDEIVTNGICIPHVDTSMYSKCSTRKDWSMQAISLPFFSSKMRKLGQKQAEKIRMWYGPHEVGL